MFNATYRSSAGSQKGTDPSSPCERNMFGKCYCHYYACDKSNDETDGIKVLLEFAAQVNINEISGNDKDGNNQDNE